MNYARRLRLDVKEFLVLVGRMFQVAFIMVVVVKMVSENGLLGICHGRNMEGCIVPITNMVAIG